MKSSHKTTLPDNNKVINIRARHVPDHVYDEHTDNLITVLRLVDKEELPYFMQLARCLGAFTLNGVFFDFRRKK
jgi:hypothetical protein